MTRLHQFLACEQGATAIEYTLIAALVALVIIGGLTALGLAVGDRFTTAGTNLAGP